MPMPVLDPNRFVMAVLSDETQKLPLPDRGGRLFLTGGETVDRDHPFYAALIADGSLQVRATTSDAEATSSELIPPEPAGDDHA